MEKIISGKKKSFRCLAFVIRVTKFSGKLCKIFVYVSHLTNREGFMFTSEIISLSLLF